MLALPRGDGAATAHELPHGQPCSPRSGSRARRTLTQRPPCVLVRLGRLLPLLLSHEHGDHLLFLFGGACAFRIINHPLVIEADVVKTIWLGGILVEALGRRPVAFAVGAPFFTAFVTLG